MKKDNTKLAIGTFFLHAIAGPPIGAYLFLFGLMTYEIIASGRLPPSFGQVFLIALPFSYVIGGGFALATGLVLSLLVYKNRYYSYLMALLVTLCVLPPVALIKIYGFGLFKDVEPFGIITMWVLPSLASTLICRWVLSRFLRKEQVSTDGVIKKEEKL